MATLVSAIGLLKRKNWARLVFVVLMGVGVLWNLASLATPFVMSSLENFNLAWTVMTAFSVVVGLAFAAVFAWIIKRLVSAEIRGEFVAP